MIVKYKVKTDLTQYTTPVQFDVVQGDINARVVELELMAEGLPWKVPDGIAVAMRYMKPDGTRGVYDKLPDGSIAWTVDGEKISIVLAPQMMTVSGIVHAQAVMTKDNYTLATFPLQINVVKDPSAGTTNSEDYVNWLQNFLKAEIDAIIPEKGVDYFTPEEQEEMVRAVIKALPVYNGEVEAV